ncbi:MAG TPA: T9SS type A sorting domain-containing protein, partial [Flavisolibacter sp.]|nr:T9SS type A sorting domain-containing protein [Flavisolibacter sp.]
NDTLKIIVKNIDNQPIDLTSIFFDNLESGLSQTYESNTVGLDSLGRYDFTHSVTYGRLRTFVNSGFAYSGNRAITLDQNRFNAPGNINYLTGTFNLSSYNVATTDVRLDFQFNNHGQPANADNRVWVRGNDTQPWIEAYSLDDNENPPGIYKKTSSIEISRFLSLNGQDFSPSFQVRWGQFGRLPATDKGLSAAGISAGYTFDDIRLYKAINDLQMLSIDTPITASCGLSNATVIKVSIRNSANATLTNIPVKYSINNGAWVTETIPSIAGNAIFQYTFTTAANMSALGYYNIQTVVDLSSDSFKENDTASTIIINSPIISTFPYLENFESGNGYWYSGGQNISWEYGTPNSSKINRAASGAKAWKTRLAGNYNDNELSYLYSPCFNISAMSAPALSFSVALDLEDCGNTLCDGVWIEYSADGNTWNKLGLSGSGTNWYNKIADQLWSLTNYTRWHVATIPLPLGYNTLHLRFVMQSDPATNYEGIAIDDIHIYDKAYSIYDSTTMNVPVTQTVSGTNWVNFINGGKIIAAINPNNQNLGVTKVLAYINATGVRHTTTQYYHDRNITIKPAIVYPTDSASIRFYFLDTETDSMIFANSCPSCNNVSSAYELGVSKYTDPDTSLENGTIADNNYGLWNFIPADKLIKVPYDKGYYAEFKVRDFSEFWLNNGSFANNIPLPVKLLDFNVQIQNANDVLTKWSVASESNVAYYDIELARGNNDLQTGHFTKIGQVQSAGNSTSLRNYNFTDLEADKFGIRFYRLKTVNLDGSYFYSPVRLVQFNEAVLWQVYPNPSNGLFKLVYQLNNTQTVTFRVIDAKGSVVKEYNLIGNGMPQKLTIDLSTNNFSSGVYLLQSDAALKKVFKLYKQ